ncbi:hypothetical protein PoB_007310700 [Plakobranchus ocellatus]|uniref:Zasp-like motif domain-containing protein n=1 Tax=Plakobranchus ocellatus TaxID=259542 RepID=A0AAV4DQQ6_9GAST|nr:hypothetical protein PoB_007310700 [Plakobranchus ocellatus]
MRGAQSAREGMRREGHNQMQVNAYVEINPEPVNQYVMPDGMVQAEAPGQRQHEEINSRPVNEYEVPAALVREESMRPKVQQPYANYTQSQQETNDTKDNSYLNLGFDPGKEKCVYVNTAGHDTNRVK